MLHEARVREESLATRFTRAIWRQFRLGARRHMSTERVDGVKRFAADTGTGEVVSSDRLYQHAVD